MKQSLITDLGSEQISALCIFHYRFLQLWIIAQCNHLFQCSSYALMSIAINDPITSCESSEITQIGSTAAAIFNSSFRNNPR